MDARAAKLQRFYKLTADDAVALVNAGLSHPKEIKKATDKQIRDVIGEVVKVRKAKK